MIHKIWHHSPSVTKYNMVLFGCKSGCNVLPSFSLRFKEELRHQYYVIIMTYQNDDVIWWVMRCLRLWFLTYFMLCISLSLLSYLTSLSLVNFIWPIGFSNENRSCTFQVQQYVAAPILICPDLNSVLTLDHWTCQKGQKWLLFAIKQRLVVILKKLVIFWDVPRRILEARKR